MQSLGELFDVYSRQARLQPALLTLFPGLVTVAVWADGLYQFGSALFGLTVACGVLYYLANLARSRGRKIQDALYAAWGGKPTVAWLRHRDRSLDVYTKQRYYRFLAEHIVGWEVPTAEEEAANAADADARYDSATRWLLEHSRDRERFPLVFAENVQFGFRRNLLGLRPIGISVATVSVLVNAVALWLLLRAALQGSLLLGLVSLLTSLVFAAGWFAAVKPDWVQDAAHGYAKALLATCESAQQGPAPTTVPTHQKLRPRDETQKADVR